MHKKVRTWKKRIHDRYREWRKKTLLRLMRWIVEQPEVSPIDWIALQAAQDRELWNALHDAFRPETWQALIGRGWPEEDRRIWERQMDDRISLAHKHGREARHEIGSLGPDNDWGWRR